MALKPANEAQTEDRQRQLLSAARQVMSDFGVRRTTVGDVAKAAGVSRQTVYEYFPNREKLIQGALKVGAARLVGAGFEAGQQRGGSPEQRLATLVEVSIEFLHTSPLWATPGKRADMVDFVALEDGTFLGAGIEALVSALGTWWPDADDVRLARAADVLARTMVSHGLSPADEPSAIIASELAELIAHGLATRSGGS